jgi:hypothetical protein
MSYDNPSKNTSKQAAKAGSNKKASNGAATTGAAKLRPIWPKSPAD